MSLLKIAVTSWIINLIYFTTSLWLFSYTSHIGHWTAKPLEAMTWTGGLLKLVLTLLVIGVLIERQDTEGRP